jgi:hypothetical protein
MTARVLSLDAIVVRVAYASRSASETRATARMVVATIASISEKPD